MQGCSYIGLPAKDLVLSRTEIFNCRAGKDTNRFMVCERTKQNCRNLAISTFPPSCTKVDEMLTEDAVLLLTEWSESHFGFSCFAGSHINFFHSISVALPVLKLEWCVFIFIFLRIAFSQYCTSIQKYFSIKSHYILLQFRNSYVFFGISFLFVASYP